MCYFILFAFLDPLNNHILSHNIDYLQFTFRWMNNLLMRELPLKASIRLWDTYWVRILTFILFTFILQLYNYVYFGQ